MKLPSSLKALLSNRIVLYVVVFLSLTNLLGYISANDTTSILVFLITGIITSYYTGNMIVILGIPMFVTNFLYSVDRGFKIRESMETMGEKNSEASETSEDKPKNAKPKAKSNGKKASKKSKPSASRDEPSDKKLAIDEDKTLTDFHKNISSILGSNEMKNMTKDTMELIQQQEGLKNAIMGMQPLLEQAKGMMDYLDIDKFKGLQSMMGSFSSDADK